MEFYVCRVCGNLVEKIHDGGTTPSCCGRQMQQLQAASTDGKKESHVPVCSTWHKGVCVHVGEVLHPSTQDHFIEWIEVVTCCGVHRRVFTPGEEPTAVFHLSKKEKVQTIYAYCSLHGLWKADGCKCVEVEDMDDEACKDLLEKCKGIHEEV